jgi:hypothetical protein
MTIADSKAFLMRISPAEDYQMRVLLLLIAVVAILALVGWITFSNEPGRTSVNLETQEIREDTKGVMKSGSEMLHKAGDGIDPNHAPQSQSPETTTTAWPTQER